MLDGKVRLAGNRLCLDFVNLPYDPGDPRPRTSSWLQLIDFIAERRITSADKCEELRALSEIDPRAAETLLV